MIYNKPLRTIIKGVSQELNLPEEVVLVAYRSYWEFIRKTIEVLPLKDDITEEDFNELKTNFNIPSIGKLYVTWDKVQSTKKRRIYLQQIRENNVTKD